MAGKTGTAPVSLLTQVPKITLTAGRLDAQVIVGSTRFGITLNPADERVKEAVQALTDAVREATKSDLAEQLELHLSPSVRTALKP